MSFTEPGTVNDPKLNKTRGTPCIHFPRVGAECLEVMEEQCSLLVLGQE